MPVLNDDQLERSILIHTKRLNLDFTGQSGMVFSGFGNTGLTATAAQIQQPEDASKKKIYCYHAFAGTVAIYSDPT